MEKKNPTKMGTSEKEKRGTQPKTIKKDPERPGKKGKNLKNPGKKNTLREDKQKSWRP